MVTLVKKHLQVLPIRMLIRLLPIMAVLILIGSIFGTQFVPSAYAAGAAEKINTHSQFQGLCAPEPTEPHCTNQDPMLQGCYKDAQTLSFHEVPSDQSQILATVQRRYSPTCHSEWGRIITSPDIHQPVSITIGTHASQVSPGPIAFTAMVFVSNLSHVSEIQGTVSLNGITPGRADGAGLTVTLPALPSQQK
ncbi:DUF2690 domain-containing protein [Dictyobacter formicarum]|uniref:DUF2690 domain-containing protein n=1 Tax=Dictyobacter formicarum TaxID=2778368 RepID=A0ABQ3V8X3_9CHLR|nr:DUF2690 domain-containing protein [Dictyobacter formicarum]GHO82345.1 hypothetical protein KSZ_03510 [Dictyobacter formicarum]